MRRDIPILRWKNLPLPSSVGLSEAQAADSRRRYGSNEILETAGNPWWALAADTLKDPMIWFLAGVGAAYWLLGGIAEALTLFASILPLAGMDAFLHRRAQASTKALGRQLAQRAWVCRLGSWLEIPAVELVPGDRVRVTTGETFPADGLFVVGENLQADESTLTGEAFPVVKRPYAGGAFAPGDGVDEDVVWVDGEHWGYAGTRLLTGQAELCVVYTGQQTLYGEIVRASRSDKARTPLQQAIGALVSLLLVGAAVLCLILGAVRLRQGYGWMDALVSAATLAVAALPEEFPVVFTVFLGVGVYRLAKYKALVRRAVSVENIGRITCICSDKTGTITHGRLRLEHLIPAEGVSKDDLLQCATFASRRETGDPLDVAILDRHARRNDGEAEPQRLATYPYTEQRRRETAVLAWPGRLRVVTKGSPETVLATSELGGEERVRWADEVDRLAASGHKVLACAWWDLKEVYFGGEPDRGARFAGLLACEDPVREGVPEAVRQCREAGIRVIMVTGDYPATARCIAREIGLGGDAPKVILGDDLAARLEDPRDGLLADMDVVARAMPTQKLALVNALRAGGEVVAVTGDGVNDVPALQAADIGLAMGERGTRSAREAAAIVLLDDNFSTLVKAIAEGRQLFRNLQLSFQYLLMIHVPLVITATFIPLAGYPILYQPIHIVWLEIIIHPTAMLVFQELPAAGRLQAAQRNRGKRFFSVAEWLVIGLVGGLITALILWAYQRSLLPGKNVEHARAMALAALTGASAMLTVLLSRMRGVWAWIMAPLSLILCGIMVQAPAVASFLHLQPLHWDDWALAMGGGLITSMPAFLLSRRKPARQLDRDLPR